VKFVSFARTRFAFLSDSPRESAHLVSLTRSGPGGRRSSSAPKQPLRSPALYERRDVAYAISPSGQRRAGAGSRGPDRPAPRQTQPRPAGPLSKLPVSGCVLGPISAGDRQGRAPLGGTLPSRGLHRHHAHRDEQGRRPLLQPAQEGRAVDQRRQSRHPLDPSLWSRLPGHRAAATAAAALGHETSRVGLAAGATRRAAPA
jgi:hypothetical protein